MPLYKKICVTPQLTVWVWKITEEESDFTVALSFFSQQKLQNMRHSLHRKAFLAIRQMLANLGIADEILRYSKEGKPELLTGDYISISHSFEYAVLAYGGVAMGVDIEKQRSKLNDLRSKYVHVQENWHAMQEFNLAILWCVKEAVYKLVSPEKPRFKEDILVDKPIDNRGVVTVLGRRYDYVLWGIDNYCLVTVYDPNC